MYRLINRGDWQKKHKQRAKQETFNFTILTIIYRMYGKLQEKVTSNSYKNYSLYLCSFM